MEIDYQNRPSVGEVAALVGADRAQWVEVLKNAEVFVTARDNGELVALSYAHGDGKTWFVPLLFVAPEHRGNRVGVDVRKTVIEECQKRTVGIGRIYGLISEKNKAFWESDNLPGMVSEPRGFTGVRIIEGTLR